MRILILYIINGVFVLLTFLSGCTSAQIQDPKLIQPGAFAMDAYLPELIEKEVGFVVNHASLLNEVHLVDTILKVNAAKNLDIDINTVFSPEHGFSGLFDAGKVIENEGVVFDSIQVISLYGKNKKPKAEDLSNLDVLVFDLQDVGVRFYTYISTLHYVMQACAENNIRLIVLDRPNPHIHYTDGPVMEEKHKSFVGMHKVPIVYGMTIGEYAKMINGERWFGDSLCCDLRVIEVSNYTRTSRYEIPVKPSPNLPNMQSILLYPTLCLFEGTKVSVGRGTDWPFQVIGHPDYPSGNFEFTPVSTPGASLYPKLENERCYGKSFVDINLDSLWSMDRMNLEIILDTYQKLDMGDAFFTDYFELLVGSDGLRTQILQGETEKEIRASWKPGLDSFNNVREKYLIYD